MNKTKVFVYPVLIILGLVVAPRMAVGMIPEEMRSMLGSTAQIDLEQMLNAFLFFGVTLAALSALINLTEGWSAINLASSITSAVVWFVLSLYLWGAGDAWSFGVISRTVTMGQNITASLVLDLRFFVAIVMGITILKILRIFLVFREARRRRYAEPELPPPPPPIPASQPEGTA